MKILHIISGLRVGGAERFLQRLITLPGAPGGACHVVVSLVELGPVGAELRAAGIEVHALGIRGPFSLPGGTVRLIRLIRSISPDIVQTWMYHADILGGVAARVASRVPVVWNVRVALGPLKFRTRVLVRIAAILSKEIPDRIICCGPVVLGDHERIGYAREKMLVIPNGYDLKHFTASAEEMAARARHGHSEITILSVGRYDPQKGFHILIEAAAELQSRGIFAKFRLVGPGCVPANRELVDQIEQKGLADQFELHGPTADMRSAYAGADIFCLPSVFEGFPNALAEAMAMALPCVATDAGDSATLAGQCATIVPTQDVVALAEALADTVNLSPGARRALGSSSRRHIEVNYALEHIATLYFEFYQGLAECETGNRPDIMTSSLELPPPAM